MAEDWASDVRRYHPEAEDEVIAGIVRYCGIALRNRDSALVSFRDADESARVRDNFLKKKLGLAHPDSELDSAIAEVGERMKGDTTKNRVTVYYLLSDRFATHDRFRRKTTPKAAKAPAAAPLAARSRTAVAAPKPNAKPARAPSAAAKPARAPATRKAGAAAAAAPLAAAPIVPAAAPPAPATVQASAGGKGEKLGFGHYRAGKEGKVGPGWLWGAIAVAAVLLVLGLLGAG